MDSKPNDKISPFLDRELADMFDRYSRAMDLGDTEAAEAILAMYPGIDEEFLTPLRGLYLLGCEARQRQEHAESDSEQPRRLGDFLLGDELGRGGMGIVYDATQISLQRNVALKILPFTAVLDPRQVARFQNEAKAAASLHHPNIVPVYGVGCERGVHYYSMQLIEGQTMAQLIRQLAIAPSSPALPDTKTDRPQNVSQISTVASIQSRAFVRNVLQLAIKLADAMHFAHEQGIIHRDIKPSNILLDQSGAPWIADFGLARGRTDSNLTSQGDQLGTLRYMSPEQAAGRNHEVDFRTDIYSLGATLYELLTLRPAFEKTDRMELLHSIQHDQSRPMTGFNRAVPTDLETIVLKAIEKNPHDRYDSADEMAQDLKRCLEGRSIVAKRKSVSERAFDYARNNKRLAAGIACGLAALIAGVSLLAAMFHGQRQREQIAAATARHHLQQAHKTVDRYGAILADRLADTPGSQPLRVQLLSESIRYYRDFLEYSADRHELAFERGQAHMHLASLFQRTGDRVAATKEFQRGIETFAVLSTPAAELEMATCQTRLGLMHHDDGKLHEAEEQFAAALSLLENREDSSARLAASVAQTQMAMLNVDRGKAQIAAQQFHQAQDNLPDNHDDPQVLETDLKVRGCYIAFLAQQDPEKAIELSRSAIGLIEQANREANPVSAETEVCHANLQNNLAILLSQSGDAAKAKPIAAAALKFWESKNKLNPNLPEVVVKLATASNTLGEIHWKEEDPFSADRAFQKAESLFRQAWNSPVRKPEHASRLAGVLHNRSHIAFGLGDLDLAIGRIDQAIDLQQTAVDLAPDNKRFDSLLHTHRQSKASFDRMQVGKANAKLSVTKPGDFIAPAKGDIQ